METTLRSHAHEFRPTILDDLGLLPALHSLVQRVAERTALCIRVDITLAGRLSPAVETALYSIMQEDLTNISKHAAATNVNLQLWHDGERLHGLLRDNGVGFAAEQVLSQTGLRGLGLLDIQERLTALGGTLQVASAPAQGTTLQITLPVDPGYEHEKHQHEVTVSAFAISRYPITRQLYRELCGTSPESRQRDSDDNRLPANDVCWFDAVSFCNALSKHVGLQPCYRIDGTHVAWDTNADGYRLPTEAEWEYACRAGTTSKWFFGDDPTALDRYAWFAANSNNRVQPVGEKAPNPWGLYDMSGNVWEWCWDWYDTYRAEAVIDPIGRRMVTAACCAGAPHGTAP